MFRGIGILRFFARSIASFFSAVSGSGVLMFITLGLAFCVLMWFIKRLTVAITSVPHVLHIGCPPISTYDCSISTFSAQVNEYLPDALNFGMRYAKRVSNCSMYGTFIVLCGFELVVREGMLCKCGLIYHGRCAALYSML